ncbi:PspC domain-containing protein [Alloactinosynnema sp. L-07]|uniref:PspC domain-containing protein n=1 Tax=Alloactinosynnema sp. L-07 TaxID=1653480 RepID=UPI0006B43132|nr:PspC domain-containing protein [Alloactinosynnema sp. L-07]
MTNYLYTDEEPKTVRKLRRSRTDRMISGVCGGIAKVLGVDAALIRIALVAATILGFGTGALIYLACWIVMPEDSSASPKF